MRYCYQKVVGVYFFGQQPIRAIILLSLLLLLLIPPYIASFAIASVHIIPSSISFLLILPITFFFDANDEDNDDVVVVEASTTAVNADALLVAVVEATAMLSLFLMA